MRLPLTREQVRQRALAMPSVLSGRSQLPGSDEAARSFLLSLAITTMGFLKPAYVIKARGGTDAAGDKWKSLAPSTIHNRRMKKGAALKVTQANKAAWRRLRQAEKAVRRAKTFRAGLAAELRLHNAEIRLANARKRYWADVDKIEILRDTGTLYNSLSPGTSGQINNGGVLRIVAGEAAFGTNVPYAAKHHHGEGRCPQRRLWPPVSRWPQIWWNDLRATARRVIPKLTQAFMGRAA